MPMKPMPTMPMRIMSSPRCGAQASAFWKLVINLRLRFNRLPRNYLRPTARPTGFPPGDRCMRRSVLVLLFALACVATGIHAPAQNRREKQEKKVEPIPRVQWIWHDESGPVRAVPPGTRYFRKVFKIDRPVQKVVDEATLDIT